MSWESIYWEIRSLVGQATVDLDVAEVNGKLQELSRFRSTNYRR